jgi:hypothetical protein
MSGHGRLFVRTESPAASAASGLAWLWRLGPLLDEPASDAVAVGAVEEEAELRPLLETGRARGLVLFAPEPGPAGGRVPGRRRADGVAGFGRGQRVAGTFTVFDDGEPAVRSSLGTHAVRDGRTLLLAANPTTAWSELRGFWCLGALAPFLAEVLGRPLPMLPPVGCVRLDDVPGTAQHQAEGTDHPDGRQYRRVRAMRRAYEAAGARLNVAVATRGLAGEEQVPLERVWPRAVGALADGVRAGVFEPVCHGYLHLDPDALAGGRVEFREFGALDREEAGRRLAAAVEWQEEVLGARPMTFVAPAWAYSEGALAAAAAAGLPAWQPPRPGPLLEDGTVRETVRSALRGLHGLDYGPFATPAAHGLPPTAVLHGGLFDLRLSQLRESRDAVTLARLALRRDILRLPRLQGLRWIGSGELVHLFECHESVQVRGMEVDVGEAEHAFLLRPGAVRPEPAGAGRAATILSP